MGDQPGRSVVVARRHHWGRNGVVDGERVPKGRQEVAGSRVRSQALEPSRGRKGWGISNNNDTRNPKCHGSDLAEGRIWDKTGEKGVGPGILDGQKCVSGGVELGFLLGGGGEAEPSHDSEDGDTRRHRSRVAFRSDP